MDIEFDETKRELTLTARGLDMAAAAKVFESAVLTVGDSRWEYGEDRFSTVGDLQGRMVVMVWTFRGDRRRIISLRKANEREQEAYRPSL